MTKAEFKAKAQAGLDEAEGIIKKWKMRDDRGKKKCAKCKKKFEVKEKIYKYIGISLNGELKYFCGQKCFYGQGGVK